MSFCSFSSLLFLGFVIFVLGQLEEANIEHEKKKKQLHIFQIILFQFLDKAIHHVSIELMNSFSPPKTAFLIKF